MPNLKLLLTKIYLALRSLYNISDINLKQIGIKSISKKNEMKVFGKNFIEIKNKKITVPNLKDHRICMSSAILSLITGIRAKINNFETVNTSSPNFLKLIKSLGANFEIKK